MHKIVTAAFLFFFSLTLILPAFAGAQANDSLQCYKVLDKALDHKVVIESFGIKSLTDCVPMRARAKSVCYPASHEIIDDGGAPTPAVVGGEIPNAVTCYKVRCRDAVALSFGNLVDSLGIRSAKKFKFKMLCIPEGDELLP